MGKQGRPSKYNEERVERILKAARKGKTKKGCARAGGIIRETLNTWLEKSRNGEDFSGFFEEFTHARAEGESELVEQCKRSDPKFLLAASYGYKTTQKKEVDMEADVTFDELAEDLREAQEMDEDS